LFSSTLAKSVTEGLENNGFGMIFLAGTEIYRITIKSIDTFNVVTYRESFLNVAVMSRALTWY